MQEMFIGDAIKKQRLALGLTQKQLCEGICEPITISRLENGKQTPSRNRLNALLKRLDMPADRFYALLNKHEMDIDALQRQIISYHIHFRKAVPAERPPIREQAWEALQKLESIVDDDDTLSKQFILRSRVLLGTETGAYCFEEETRMLSEAIRLTAPYFDLNNIGCGLYSIAEIKIINQLALAYARAGKHLDAINIFTQLYQYIQKHFQNSLFNRTRLSMVTYNFAKELCAVGKYQKAIELAKEGQKACLDYGHYHSLPGLLAIQADCYHLLNDDAKSREYYRQAYYLMKIIGDESNLQILKRKAEKEINLSLED